MNDRARRLRRNQTDSEKLLWRLLRNRQLCDCKFRRQHPIGPYIADLVYQERWLIVELDGGQHASQSQQDFERTAYLESRGFRVLRFWNHQVLQETDAVVEVIRQALEVDLPSPQPSP